MYKVGEMVVHPLYGAGVINSITIDNMYELKLDSGRMIMSVPIDSAEQVGLRKVHTSAEINVLLDKIQSDSREIDLNWSKRYKDNLEKIKSGKLLLVSQVVADLIKIDRSKGLSTGEKKMLNNAKKILVSEVACVKDLCEKDAEKLIYSIIKNN
ncbi:MAG: CarD family transcriptional regulator [Eubacteriaceae bacterium]